MEINQSTDISLRQIFEKHMGAAAGNKPNTQTGRKTCHLFQASRFIEKENGVQKAQKAFSKVIPLVTDRTRTQAF